MPIEAQEEKSVQKKEPQIRRCTLVRKEHGKGPLGFVVSLRTSKAQRQRRNWGGDRFSARGETEEGEERRTE